MIEANSKPGLSLFRFGGLSDIGGNLGIFHEKLKSLFSQSDSCTKGVFIDGAWVLQENL